MGSKGRGRGVREIAGRERGGNGKLDKRMEAKEEELRSWKENKVYKEIVKRGNMGIPTMWIMTKKIKNGEERWKARLVVRGFKERNRQKD